MSDLYQDFLDAPKATDPVGTVVGKFYVTGVELTGPYGAKVRLSAVSRGARNASWSQATPSGTIELFVSNKAAVAQYLKALHHEGGPEFLVTMTHAPTALPEDGHPFEASPKGHYTYPNCAECAGPEDRHATGQA